MLIDRHWLLAFYFKSIVTLRIEWRIYIRISFCAVIVIRENNNLILIRNCVWQQIDVLVFNFIFIKFKMCLKNSCISGDGFKSINNPVFYNLISKKRIVSHICSQIVKYAIGMEPFGYRFKCHPILVITGYIIITTTGIPFVSLKRPV